MRDRLSHSSDNKLCSILTSRHCKSSASCVVLFLQAKQHSTCQFPPELTQWCDYCIPAYYIYRYMAAEQSVTEHQMEFRLLEITAGRSVFDRVISTFRCNPCPADSNSSFGEIVRVWKKNLKYDSVWKKCYMTSDLQIIGATMGTVFIQ